MEPTSSLTTHLVRGWLLAAAVLLLWAAPSAAQAPREYPNPVLGGQNPVADPGVLLRLGDYYVASTSDLIKDRGCRPRCALPIWKSSNLEDWDRHGYVFTRLPHWVDHDSSMWAPQIYYFHETETYVAYYTAVKHGDSKLRCIGRATSDHLGDFTDRGFRGGDPLCNPSYSLIDASLFSEKVGEDWRRYLLYKRDRPVGGDLPKQIVIRTANERDGGSPLGRSHVILFPTGAQGGWERDSKHPSVEAPTMVRGPKGVFPHGPYYLFYSGSLWSSDDYGVGVARSRDPLGRSGFEFERNEKNPILTGEGTDSFCGVGGQDVTEPRSDGDSLLWHVVYHAWPRVPGREPCEPKARGRRLMVDDLIWDSSNGWPTVNGPGDGPSEAQAASR
jgi:beta-xylosidase